jgi:TetR/AcrR family transcriptional repressor of nem operon
MFFLQRPPWRGERTSQQPARCGVVERASEQMRYPPDHKERTRQKVLELAAADLCNNGIEGTGIAEIMGAAGLTHGGFYAHFASKDEMVAAAVTHIFGRLMQKLETGVAEKGAEKTFDLFIKAYLSAEHRDNPASGCPIAALAGEMRRQPSVTKQAYDESLERYIGVIATLLPPKSGRAQTDLAASLLSEMVGAMLLARCAVDDKTSERVLSRARRSVKARCCEAQAIQ